MGNSWFQFQEFRIDQARSSMKVCTDSCLFGAYVPVSQARRILDMGAGTGLLGLMAAQRNPDAEIYFVEPDSGSFEDLKHNLWQSPWRNRLYLVEADLKTFVDNRPQAFDVVICNPPFFLNHLEGKNVRKKKAMHISYEEWGEWCFQLGSLVKPDGQLWLLLPGLGAEKMISHIQSTGFQYFEYLDLIQNGKPWRTIVGLQRGEGASIKKAWLEIRKPNGSLSDQALELMKDYYLAAPKSPPLVD